MKPNPKSIAYLADFCKFWSRWTKRTSISLYLVCLLPPLLILAAAFGQPYVDVAWLLRDPATVVRVYGVPDHTPAYYGLVSNLGVLVWSVAASVCLFVGSFLFIYTVDLKRAAFFLFFGFFTAILVVDDLFMVHETVFPFLTKLSSDYLLLAYGLLYISGFLIFWKLIFEHNVMLMALACVFFATSVIFDVFIVNIATASAAQWLIEDGSKFLGIFAWTTFYVSAAWDSLAQTRI